VGCTAGVGVAVGVEVAVGTGVGIAVLFAGFCPQADSRSSRARMHTSTFFMVTFLSSTLITHTPYHSFNSGVFVHVRSIISFQANLCYVAS
jgi:hypothetical protein